MPGRSKNASRQPLVAPAVDAGEPASGSEYPNIPRRGGPGWIAVRLKPKDVAHIEKFLRGGIQQVRVVLRALALRQLAHGVTAPRVAQALPLTPKAVCEIAHRYEKGGLDRAWYDKPRPGAKPLLDDSQKQRIVAMVCGKPPEGRARWTVRLIAEEAIKRKLVPHAGRETIRCCCRAMT